jgi:hypothetical protein
MAKARSTDKFFVYAARHSGYNIGRRLLGVNPNYNGDIDNLSIEDLVQFLNKNNLDLNKVRLPSNFLTTASI